MAYVDGCMGSSSQYVRGPVDPMLNWLANGLPEEVGSAEQVQPVA